MNIFIIVLLVFAFLGMIDKFIGGKFGLAYAFDEGLKTMGSLCFSMTGIYCGAVYFTTNNRSLVNLAQKVPFDMSILAGALLAPDLGGYPVAVGIAQNEQIGQFTGILVSSMLGCLISFVLPISLGVLPEREHRSFIEGSIWGIITLPIGLFLGGLIIGMSMAELAKGILPIGVVCSVLILGLHYAPKKSIFVMQIIGKVVHAIGTILFVILVFGLFVPSHAIFSQTLAGESMIIVAKIVIVVCGSLVINAIFMRHGKTFFARAARKMDINEQSIMGLLISFATSISMLPMYEDMDEKGKRMNAAFSVGGAFCLGGQLAYIASVADHRGMMAYMIGKFVCGLSAIWLTTKCYKCL